MARLMPMLAEIMGSPKPIHKKFGEFADSAMLLSYVFFALLHAIYKGMP